jgi:hypothetical protein
VALGQDGERRLLQDDLPRQLRFFVGNVPVTNAGLVQGTDASLETVCHCQARSIIGRGGNAQPGRLAMHAPADAVAAGRPSVEQWGDGEVGDAKAHPGRLGGARAAAVP